MFPISKTRTLKLRILSKATQLGCRIWFQPPVSLSMRPVLLGEMTLCGRRQLSDKCYGGFYKVVCEKTGRGGQTAGRMKVWSRQVPHSSNLWAGPEWWVRLQYKIRGQFAGLKELHVKTGTWKKEWCVVATCWGVEWSLRSQGEGRRWGRSIRRASQEMSFLPGEVWESLKMVKQRGAVISLVL